VNASNADINTYLEKEKLHFLSTSNLLATLVDKPEPGWMYEVADGYRTGNEGRCRIAFAEIINLWTKKFYPGYRSIEKSYFNAVVDREIVAGTIKECRT